MLWKSNSHKWMPASYKYFAWLYWGLEGFFIISYHCGLRDKLTLFIPNPRLSGIREETVQRLYLPWGSHDLSFACAGKCICLGKGIAWNESFIFFTGILQNLSLASPVAPENIDLTPIKSGAGKIPSTYQIHFLSRCMGWERKVNGLMFPQLHTLWME